jgi:hypothetical protein
MVLDRELGYGNGAESKKYSAEIRDSTCQFRLENGTLQRNRDVRLLFAMQVPICYFGQDRGFVKYDWGNRIVDPYANRSITAELLVNFTVVELAEFLFRTGEFRCPFAQADICPVIEDTCSSGYVHFVQFPESEECTARSILLQCDVIQKDE